MHTVSIFFNLCISLYFEIYRFRSFSIAIFRRIYPNRVQRHRYAQVSSSEGPSTGGMRPNRPGISKHRFRLVFIPLKLYLSAQQGIINVVRVRFFTVSLFHDLFPFQLIEKCLQIGYNAISRIFLVVFHHTSFSGALLAHQTVSDLSRRKADPASSVEVRVR